MMENNKKIIEETIVIQFFSRGEKYGRPYPEYMALDAILWYKLDLIFCSDVDICML